MIRGCLLVSLGDLLGEVTRDLSTLIRQEIELAKAEPGGRLHQSRADTACARLSRKRSGHA
jgi:hypothetical protein